ncbi:hypothetical protein [Hydromonas duriensis]|uniref:Uncharacterized protein n=1 Tax=Hydromonas duriensis TaxID=1527608 RepID=A0A4R6YBF1_9BURK|nr:hypothetical protein [Hydromonas duriensis]TDR32953.1 hypothetical protein DFR44_1012 [Hydromonas duriensis]
MTDNSLKTIPKDCCSFRRQAPVVIPISGVSTNNKLVGTSVRTVEVKGKVRFLTEGEKKMAKRFYSNNSGGSLIPYDKVTIREGMFADYDDRAVTKNGTSIHWPSPSYEEDFSKASLVKQKTFIHEMAHIWQYHCGGWVALNSLYHQGVSGQAAYNYDLDHLLGYYPVEAQAHMIEDYYALRYFGAPNYKKTSEDQYWDKNQKKYISGPVFLFGGFAADFIEKNNLNDIYLNKRYLYEAALEPYKKALRYFLQDPTDKRGYTEKGKV